MKRTTKLLALILALLLLPLTIPAAAASDPAEENNTVYLAVEDYGLIVIELYADKAPITVANFKKLVKEDFYDGLIFHRVIEQFMIQGGDPLGTGQGGSSAKIKGEFSENGVDTGIKHVEGTISMARQGHPYEGYYNAGYMDLPLAEREPYYNSASSQFFIVTETSAGNTSSLDGKYAAFGQVIEGMDVVKEIAATETDSGDKPVDTVRIATITFDRAEAEAALDTTDNTALIIVGVLCAALLIGSLVTVAILKRKKKAVPQQSTAKPTASNRRNKGKKPR